MTQTTNIPELDNSISFVMGLSYKQFRTLANRKIIKKFDITLEMLGVLRVLAYKGKIIQQELAQTLNSERSATKRLVDNCIKRGLIDVFKSDLNKKVRYLILTPKGLHAKEEANRSIQKIISNYYSPLTDDEQQTLKKLCQKLIQKNLILSNH